MGSTFSWSPGICWNLRSFRRLFRAGKHAGRPHQVDQRAEPALHDPLVPVQGVSSLKGLITSSPAARPRELSG
jgi:hypothetical protein